MIWVIITKHLYRLQPYLRGLGLFPSAIPLQVRLHPSAFNVLNLAVTFYQAQLFQAREYPLFYSIFMIIQCVARISQERGDY